MHNQDGKGSATTESVPGDTRRASIAAASPRALLPHVALFLLLALLIGLSFSASLDHRLLRVEVLPTPASTREESAPNTAADRVLAWEMEGVAWIESASEPLASSPHVRADEPEVRAVLHPATATPKIELEVRAILYPVTAGQPPTVVAEMGHAGPVGDQWKSQFPLWRMDPGDRTASPAEAPAISTSAVGTPPEDGLPHPLILGMYTSASLQVTSQELQQINSWLEQNGLNSRVTIAATYMDFEFPNPEANIPLDLDAAWDLGIIPFINLAAGTLDVGPRTAEDIALGDLDGPIRVWARNFAAWAGEQGKKAYVAPLQEMNGYWTAYGLDPDNFKRAYYRIRRLFAEEGVPEDAVIWVFAPNGWSPTGHDFERYYPGDAYVDIVAFSGFNYGACSGHAAWETFEVVFKSYLERMRQMAPSKPIFIAQTGTVANGGDKDAWLVDTFTKFAAFDGLAGILYFNVIKQESPACEWVDWRVFDPESGTGSSGFIEALRAIESAATPILDGP